MDVTIRDVTLLDAERLAELSAQLGYPIEPTEAAEIVGEVQGGGRDRILVAADQSDRAIGWVHLSFATTLTTGWFGIIVGLVVDEAFRGQGVGKALVRAALEKAREFGVPSVRVRSQTKRVEAHGFYRSLGFVEKKEQKVFDIDLG